MNWKNREDISLDELREKNAIFVGGEDGVFASYAEGNLVKLCAGDDGNWWHIGSCDARWIPGIVKSLIASARSAL